MLPLIVVLAVTGTKDAYEDIKRHQADRAVNNTIVHILAGEGYENVNPMREKSKTFVKRVPIPRIKSKKAKQREREAAAKQEEQGKHRDADVPDSTTGPRLERARSQVSVWRDDPDAADAPKELGWHRQVWEDLRVGDFVKLYDGEQFPAGE
jgi:phospholipid-translocating ATPase